jgi:hypothetical protein
MITGDELVAAIDAYLEADRPAQKQRATRYLETRVRAQLRRTWRAQRTQALAKLSKQRANFPPERSRAIAEAAMRADQLDSIPGGVKNDPALIAVIQASAGTAFDIAINHVIAELAITSSFDITIPAAADWMRTWGATRVSAIDDITRARLRRVLVEAVESNWSYQQTARQITSLFDGFTARSPLGHIRNRAELISVTEIGDAYEYAGKVMADQLTAAGTLLDKEWLTASSDVCPTCSSAAGEGWIHGDDSFSNGLDGPLGHPGCRCSLARRARPQTTVRR